MCFIYMFSLDTKPSSSAASGDDEPKTTKVIIKGKVPVDPQCYAKVNTAHVLHDGDNVYNFMLNQVSFRSYVTFVPLLFSIS